MTQVLTLIAGSKTFLDTDTLKEVDETLKAAGARPSKVRWLAEGHACDIEVLAEGTCSLETTLQDLLAERPIDWALQPTSQRRKRLLLADMDSTIVTSETLDDLAEIAGIGERIAAITARAMAGEIDFAGALRERVALLKDLPLTALGTTVEGIELTAGARQLVQTMRAHGAYTALVSGGFSFATSHVRNLCGFHEDRSNQLVIHGDRLAGKVEEPILGQTAKLEIFHCLLGKLALQPDQACTIGDGANDLAMLEAAGLGLAFHGKPVVREKARYRLDHTDLTGALFFQGYRADEFVE